MDPRAVVPFLHAALDGMAGIVEALGDDLANTRPDLPGANSPYAILHHSLAVAEWWIGLMVAGRAFDRDRDAEFSASGSTAGLIERVAAARERIAADVAAIEPSDPIRHPERLASGSAARSWSQAAALIHTLEELAQHHGQMELTRDVLLAAHREPGGLPG